MQQHNKYDSFLVVLIVSLVFGSLGNGLQVPRVLALLLSPFLFFHFKCIFKLQQLRKVYSFFLFFYFYSFLSIVWTPNISDAIKEYLYYFTHMLYFGEIVVFSLKAKAPEKSIRNAWLIMVILTIPIALFEIFTGIHLGVSVFDSDRIVNVGGGIVVEKKFASVTFGNYNTYATVLCLACPFIFMHLLYPLSKFKQLLNYLTLLIILYILFTIASRGALLIWGIVIVIYWYFRLKLKIRNDKFILFLVICVLIYGVLNYSADIFEQINNRIQKGESQDESLLEDTGRMALWGTTLIASLNSIFFGHGIASVQTVLENLNSSITFPHNLLLEILVQYGLVITVLFLLFVIRILKKGRLINDLKIKFLIYSSISVLPIVSIINSGYLLMVPVWAFFASLFVYTYIVSSKYT